MSKPALPPVIIPAADYVRLEQLARLAWSDQHPAANFLLSEIRRAWVVDEFVFPGQNRHLEQLGDDRPTRAPPRAGSWSIWRIMFPRSANCPCCLPSEPR